MADLLALKGDAVDNIPGAPGIGEKGAQDLIEQFGSVEAALDRAAEVRAQDVSRKPAEQSRAHPDEQAAGDHRYATCRSPFELDALRSAGARCRSC